MDDFELKMPPKKESKRWSREETKAFLNFYYARRKEFDLPRKRRFAYGHVVEDMTSAGFDTNMTVHHLEVKMQTLLRSYKAAKDNAKDTGASPCLPPFFNEMEDIFGDKPHHLPSTSHNFGVDVLFESLNEVDLTHEGDNLMPSPPSTTTAASTPTAASTTIAASPSTVLSTAAALSNANAAATASATSTSTLIRSATATSPIIAGTSSPLVASNRVPAPARRRLATPAITPAKKINRADFLQRRLEQKEIEQEAIAERWRKLEIWQERKFKLMEQILKK